MIIHAKLVKLGKQMTNHICWGCKKEVAGVALRVFGSSGNGETPYRIYCCIPCAKQWKDKKINEALEKGAM